LSPSASPLGDFFLGWQELLEHPLQRPFFENLGGLGIEASPNDADFARSQ
jgi:hypothetical protein